MAHYRTTVILKTDIVDSTTRLATQTQTEMGLQREQHKQFIHDIAVNFNGSILEEEGDAYWIEFPSVTGAALAGIEMQQQLRLSQAGKSDKQRLAIRIVITLGDILYQESDTIGMTMSLTARIEKITPPDEIYISQAAWLVLNKAEILTTFIGEFKLKGFRDPEKVYKVEHKHRTHILTDQFIIFTDISSWTTFIKTESIENIEGSLIDYENILNTICDNYSGTVRNISGDNAFLTFAEPQNLFPALEMLTELWKTMIEKYQLGISVAIHKGNINILRTYLYGHDIHVAFYLKRICSEQKSDKTEILFLASKMVKDSAYGSIWEDKFYELNHNDSINDTDRKIMKEYGAFLFNSKRDVSI